jgi:hypothetical protein
VSETYATEHTAGRMRTFAEATGEIRAKARELARLKKAAR